MTTRDELLAAVDRLHQEVDALARAIAARLPDTLRCRPGCADCCLDGLVVFAAEAELIALRHGGLLRGARSHPRGNCAFLGEDLGCRIYGERPYVCRVQGLPLRWLEEDRTGNLAERRDVCPRSELDLSVAALPEECCWPVGPFEQRLAELQRQLDGSLERVALRSLFAGAAR